MLRLRKIDQFVEELVQSSNKYGRMQPKREDSPLSKLTCTSWGGANVVEPSAGEE